MRDFLERRPPKESVQETEEHEEYETKDVREMFDERDGNGYERSGDEDDCGYRKLFKTIVSTTCRIRSRSIENDTDTIRECQRR